MADVTGATGPGHPALLPVPVASPHPAPTVGPLRPAQMVALAVGVGAAVILNNRRPRAGSPWLAARRRVLRRGSSSPGLAERIAAIEQRLNRAEGLMVSVQQQLVLANPPRRRLGRGRQAQGTPSVLAQRFTVVASP